MAASLGYWGPESAIYTTNSSNANPQLSYASGTNFPRLSLAFDPTSRESCFFSGVMPQVYAAGVPNMRIFWTSAGTLAVVWKLQWWGRVDDDIFDATVEGSAQVTDTVTTANDLMVASITMAATFAAGNALYFQLSREPADAADTSAEDALFLGMELQQ